VPQPPRLVEQREQLRALVSQLQSLPERQRRALVAYTMEGVSHDEIAAELGVSRPAARQLIFRAREALREVAAVLVPMPLLRTLGKTSSGGAQAAGATKGGMLSLAALKGTAAVATMGATASLAVVGIPAVVHTVQQQGPTRHPVSVSRYRNPRPDAAARSLEHHLASRETVTAKVLPVLSRCAGLTAPPASTSSPAGGHQRRATARSAGRWYAADCRTTQRQYAVRRKHALAARKRDARSRLAARRRVTVQRARALSAGGHPAVKSDFVV